MSYVINKAVELYYDALMHYNIVEKDNVKKVSISGNVVIIEANNRMYMRTIKRQRHGSELFEVPQR